MYKRQEQRQINIKYQLSLIQQWIIQALSLTTKNSPI